MICSQLDDYLCGELRDTENRAFEAHTGVCQACAEAVELDGQLMNRLREASTTLECPSRIAIELTKPQRTDRSGRLAVATSIAVLVGFMVALTQPPTPPAHPEHSQIARRPVAAAPTVQLPAGQSAASIPSGDPNIRILMVFGNDGNAGTSDNPSFPHNRNLP